MDTHPKPTEYEDTKQDEDLTKLVGRRVEYQNEIGTIKYSGPLKHNVKDQDPGQIWLGIQWDNHTRGKHNGTVEGVQYFICNDGKNSGTLLKYQKANLGINIFDGIHTRYFYKTSGTADSSQENTPVNKEKPTVEYDEEAYFETSKKFKKKVEFIGFDRIWKKINDLQNIKELSLPQCNISDIGPDGSLRALVPKLTNLSIESNLLYDWNQVFLIGRELKELRELSVSGNKLKEPDQHVSEIKTIYVNSNDTIIPEAPINVFSNLQVIALISMNLTWKTLDKLLPMFTNVHELILCFNQLSDFENLTLTGSHFKNLELLNMEGNNLQSFDGLLKLKDSPRLSKLILNKNNLKDLGEIKGFEFVQTVIMEDNNIADFRIFSQLAQFPKLEILRVTKNPLSKNHNPLHTRQRAIAEIKSLKIVNGGELKKYERKDCEIYYLRNAFHEFFEKSGQSGDEFDFEQFKEYALKEHPRIPELMKMYGNPYEDGIKNKPKIEVAKPKAGVLTLVNLNAFTGPQAGKPAIAKKFTDNTLIVNLKAMLSKMFGITAGNQKIYCKNAKDEPFVLMDEDLKDLRFYGVKPGSEIWVGDTEL